MTTKRRILSLAVVSLLAATLVGGATGAYGVNRAESIEYGIGSVTTIHEGGTLERSVEAWVAADGRYRVVTTSLDRTNAAEGVVSDGKTQHVFVTDPGGSTSVIEGDFVDHFAVQYDEPDARPGETVTNFELASNGLAARIEREYDSGSRSELRIEWASIDADAELLDTSANVSAKSLDAAWLDPVPIRGTEATGSNSTTMVSVTDYTACVYAYNFRNTGTGYFRATSSSRGSCYYMDETLWKGAKQGGPGGSCSQEAWQGSGPTLANFSSKYVYTSPDNMSPTCTTHAGWLTDWTLAVPWYGLNTSV